MVPAGSIPNNSSLLLPTWLERPSDLFYCEPPILGCVYLRCPNVGPSSSQKLKVAGTPCHPSQACPPTLQIGGALSESQSGGGGVRLTSPGLLFLPHLSPGSTSVLKTPWVFPPPGTGRGRRILRSPSFQTSFQVVSLIGKKAERGQDFCSSLNRR